MENPVVSQQVTRDENFGWEQKQDEQLKHCWGQVCIIEDEDQ